MSEFEAKRPAVRREGYGFLAMAVAFAIALAASLAADMRGGFTGIEFVSFRSSDVLGRFARALPLGYAFGAGMVAAVNPCGFALLPAFLGYYLGDASGESRTGAAAFGRAAWVSVSVSAGFVILFGAVGLALSVATATMAGFFGSVFPWVGLLVGLMLIIAGGRMLDGAGLYTTLGERVASRLGSGARRADARGYLMYGLAYGAASLSCTLPIFLSVMGSATAVGGLAAGALQFVLYALGMGLVVTLLTLSTAVFKRAALARVRRAGRWMQPASAVLLLLAGAYIVYYWLTLGGLLAALG